MTTFFRNVYEVVSNVLVKSENGKLSFSEQPHMDLAVIMK